MSAPAYDITRHAHHVTYEVTRRHENQFMERPDTAWMLTAQCADCGWLHHETITNRGDDPFTQHHRDVALRNHHLGVGMFVVPKAGRVGNDIFIREADNSYWQLTYKDGDWERTRL